MDEFNDARVLELSQARLRLRDDLRFAADEFAGRPCYIIEDPLTSHYFRVGVDEYFFLSLLDGHTTVEQAIAVMAQSRGRDGFTQQDAANICGWLLEGHLATTEATVQPDRLSAAAGARARQAWAGRLNPLLVKVRLCNPDRALEVLTPLLGWLLSWPALGVWAACLVVGISQIAAQCERFRAASVGVLAPGNWVALAVTWVALKVLHELAHGVACKKFGGNVLECGIVLILFTPVAYVDATGAWRLPGKWQRIVTSAAGMYAELFCASLAAWVWSCSGPGVVGHVAYNVVITAGLSTLMVNGNPLMRFDAYYMLADFLEIPNLSVRGQQYVLELGRSCLLGIHGGRPRQTAPVLVGLYGMAACVWRTLVLIGLVIAARALFAGAGLVAAIAAAGLWFGVPAARFAKYLIAGNSWERPRMGTFLLRAGGAVALVSLLMATVPWPGIVRAPAVVQAAPQALVRCEVAGFVEQVCVGNNQPVRQGQIVARLVNRELVTELRDLQLEVQEIQVLRDKLRLEENLADLQIETQNLAALHKRLAEKKRQLDKLTLRAPISGRAICRRPASLVGTYVEPGRQLLAIAGPRAELAVSIGQDDLEWFTQRIGRSVAGRLRGESRLHAGRLTSIRPHASRDVTRLALTAAAGGPLAVQRVAALPGSASRTAGGESLQFLAPRFEGIVQIESRGRRPLAPGRLATVWFRTHHETIGQHIGRCLTRWLRDRVRAAQDA